MMDMSNQLIFLSFDDPGIFSVGWRKEPLDLHSGSKTSPFIFRNQLQNFTKYSREIFSSLPFLICVIFSYQLLSGAGGV
jgi:hypothetical protein